MKKYLSVVVFCFVSLAATADYQIDIVTKQLQRPWSLAFLPDGRFLVTERVGHLRIVDQQGLISPPLGGLPAIAVIGQGGLLDVILHPDFVNNQWLYLSFAAGDAKRGYSTEVVRARLQDDRLVDSQIIFQALPKSQKGHHFGGRLAFDSMGYLFISLGDRGERDEAQKLSSHNGSIIRLHDDGRIPNDNPFVNRPNAKSEIYSYGHRNIQGLAMNPSTGVMWAHEHGPQGGDEINIIAAGKNYGWPVVSYGAEYGSGLKIGEGTRKAGMEQPVHYWDPSIAPSGMAFFQNDLLVGALKFQLLARLQLQQGLVLREQRLFQQEFGRIRDVRRVDNTTFYLLTDSDQGQLIRIRDLP